MSQLVHESTGYHVVEEEPPELLGRNLNSAAHLLASATAFFFFGFFFAYFYLRSLDNADAWRPRGIDPSLGYGTVVMALIALSAVLVRLGLAQHRAGQRPRWRRLGAAALAVGLAGVVLQVVEWTAVGFGPADGAYASVFFGWTASTVLFSVGALFWLENILATSVRYRNVASGVPAPGEASGDPGRRGHDVRDPVSLVRPGLEALSFYWAFLAALEILAWIVLYLV